MQYINGYICKCLALFFILVFIRLPEYHILQFHSYIINSDGSLVKSALPGFDPAKDELTIFGNMFDWTVKLSTDKDDYYYALDATDYSLIKEHAYKDIRRSVPGVSFTSPDDKFVKPRF